MFAFTGYSSQGGINMHSKVLTSWAVSEKRGEYEKRVNKKYFMVDEVKEILRLGKLSQLDSLHSMNVNWYGSFRYMELWMLVIF